MALLAKSMNALDWTWSKDRSVGTLAGFGDCDLVRNGDDFEVWEKGTAPPCAPESKESKLRFLRNRLEEAKHDVESYRARIAALEAKPEP